MMTSTQAPEIYIFDVPIPSDLMQVRPDYYAECRLAGAPSVEVTRDDGPPQIISATRYLPAGVHLTAVDHHGVLQVLCTQTDGRQTVLREYTDWTRYTVHRADHPR